MSRRRRLGRPFMLRMALSTLRDGPRPDTVSRRTESLVASVAQHHRAISAHQSQLLAAVVELDRRKAWRVDGATSMVAWLVQRCGVTATTAREWVTAAGKLHQLPKISDALSQGKLSFDQVKPLVEVAKPETDAKLAEQATHWSAKQVRELAIAARNQSDDQATGFYARRFLRFDDRRRTFTGVLPQDQYTVVKSSLIARTRRRLGDHTPFDQRMADALVAVCKNDAKGAPATPHRPGRPSPEPEARTAIDPPSLSMPTWASWQAVMVGPSSTCSGRCPGRWPAGSPAMPRCSSRPTDLEGRASTWEGHGEIPQMRSGWRSGAGTRAVDSPAAPTPSSPMCTTSATGSTAARQICATSSSSAISITAVSTRWDGRCRATPTSN